MTLRSPGVLSAALTASCVAATLTVPAAVAVPDAAARVGQATFPSAAGDGTWVWPVAGPRVALRQFEAPATRYSAGHRGVDLSAPAGTSVVAPADGAVSFAGTVVDRPVLSITFPGGLVASIEPVVATVVEGDQVLAGAVIGTVASGGHCSGSCAHFGVRLHGEYVNPLALLESLQRAVLLPLEG